MLFPTSSLLFFTLAAATLTKGYVNYTVSTITTRILATKTYLVPVWVDDDDDDDEGSTSGHMGNTLSALVTDTSFLEISNTDAVSTKFPEFTDTFSKSIHNPDPTEVKTDTTSPVTNDFFNNAHFNCIQHGFTPKTCMKEIVRGSIQVAGLAA
ncbi:hypothetical protein HF325_006616 [Metschnikowia pulcherrima]|uniref:Uncharacterized protein n=1 Tax=Metschnikowia pulcherrima TaxID=27326 RepID=A0A8H7L8K0_9ASCO|nr:hypothetical protein HF325_006616 [Metschnikowia pulcherrima]